MIALPSANHLSLLHILDMLRCVEEIYGLEVRLGYVPANVLESPYGYFSLNSIISTHSQRRISAGLHDARSSFKRPSVQIDACASEENGRSKEERNGSLSFFPSQTRRELRVQWIIVTPRLTNLI